MGSVSCEVGHATQAPVWSAPSVRPLRIGLLGYGRVGQAVARLVHEERETWRAAGWAPSCVRALVRDAGKTRHGPPLPLVTGQADVDLADCDVIVEALGGAQPASTLVARALAAGLSVVTANKTLVAHHGPALRRLAASRGVGFSCDAAVVAGVPFLGALRRRPLLAGAQAFAGVINGTSHAVLEAVAGGLSFDRALASAVVAGYAEPDATADVSGLDAAEKLTILLHLSGIDDAVPAGLPRIGIDVIDEIDFALARQLEARVVPVAIADLRAGRAGTWIGPAAVSARHPLASLTGVDNALQIVTGRGHHLLFAGPGAGPDATAATVLDDVIEIANGDGLSAGAAAARPGVAWRQPPVTPWLLRVDRDADARSRLAHVLRRHDIVVTREIAAGETTAVVTAPVAWAAIEPIVAGRRALPRLRALPAVGLAAGADA